MMIIEKKDRALRSFFISKALWNVTFWCLPSADIKDHEI